MMRDFENHVDSVILNFDLTGFTYDPQNFRELYETDLGAAALIFMTRPAAIALMCAATDIERAAVEPLAPFLVQVFGDAAIDDRFKQMIGHMARQVLEHIGYYHDRKSVQITRANLFSTASGYRKSPKDKNTMRVTPEQRAAWLMNTAKGPFNQWLDGQVKVDGVFDLKRLYEVAEKWGVTKRYDHLNPGQQRMNIGVALRKVVPESEYT
ncbi:hypothetical protein FFR93_07640 [Rhizobium sp. MHM7A]|nr:hypothetical protein FFR93_07640 [Rhizobium sp. MHM7A]